MVEMLSQTCGCQQQDIYCTKSILWSHVWTPFSWPLVSHPLVQLVKFLLPSPVDSTPQRGSASPCPRCRTMTVPALQRLQQRRRGSWCSLETSHAGFTCPSLLLSEGIYNKLFHVVLTTHTNDHPKTCLGSLPCKPQATTTPQLDPCWLKAIYHKRTAFNAHKRTSNWQPMFEILGRQTSISWPCMIK